MSDLISSEQWKKVLSEFAQQVSALPFQQPLRNQRLK